MGFDAEQFQPIFKKIYGSDQQSLNYQTKRYHSLYTKYTETYGSQSGQWFSTPGRTELGGNHTDHNHGRVLAAAINQDSIALAAANDQNKVVIHSVGFEQPFIIDLDRLEMDPFEKGTTTALGRGIAARLTEFGYKAGGFNAWFSSDVLQGSGLSSSASIEVLIGTIFSSLYNQNSIDPLEIAKIGQYAENYYFGKPCGLMDQIACAVGGIVSIDFQDPLKPLVKKLPIDFRSFNHALIVVDSGGSHADLTEDYAAIPDEMKKVAKACGHDYGRDIQMDDFLGRIAELRQSLGDRAILRMLHFLGENERVSEQVKVLAAGNFKQFLALVRESGDSSFKWLQNVFSPSHVSDQGITLALALTDKFIHDHSAGACRIHGGGFAGTILVFLPLEQVNSYKKLIEPVFGSDSIVQLQIREEGTLDLSQLV